MLAVAALCLAVPACSSDDGVRDAGPGQSAPATDTTVPDDRTTTSRPPRTTPPTTAQDDGSADRKSVV